MSHDIVAIVILEWVKKALEEWRRNGVFSLQCEVDSQILLWEGHTWASKFLENRCGTEIVKYFWAVGGGPWDRAGRQTQKRKIIERVLEKETWSEKNYGLWSHAVRVWTLASSSLSGCLTPESYLSIPPLLRGMIFINLFLKDCYKDLNECS